MGIHAELIDFDQEFNQLSNRPRLVNDFNTSIPEEKEELDRYIFIHYKHTDTIDTAASCHCGKYTEARFIGHQCELCGIKVESTTDRAIESVLWIRAPDGVTALINPEVWMILEPAMKTKDFNFLEYLTNTEYSFEYKKITAKDARRRVDKFLTFNPPRGLNNFVEHFDRIMGFMLDNNIIDSNKLNKADLRQFIQENRSRFFPKYLPIPSRICFVVETTTPTTYVDKPLGDAMDAIRTIESIRASQYPKSPQKVQNLSQKAVASLASFYQQYTRDRLSKKPGVFRRHVFGARLHFSARGVITSIAGRHRYGEIHIPWGMGLQLLKYHILNKLHRRGYTTREGLELIYTHVLQYNEELDRILQELIAESPDGLGLPCSLQRNPTLQRGSTQFFHISKIKTKVTDNTISMSSIVLRAPNADFDGDQLNLILIPDNTIARRMERIASHLWVLSLDRPHELAGSLLMQGPVIETSVNMVHGNYLNE